MVERIMEYKKRKGWKDFTVVGVGGVVKPEDYFSYKKLGCDAVMSATGAMWRPTLAQEIREKL
jgi:dihydroorotate dehydrogenase